MPGTRGRRLTWIVRVAALVLAACWAALPAVADETLVGPPVGQLRYQGDIAEAGDEDDFTGQFVVGDVLSVQVVSRRADRREPPTLRPLLVLVDPDGTLRFSSVFHDRNGLSASLRSYRIDRAGLWAVRIAGKEGTTGRYGVLFRVKQAGKTVLRRQILGENLPPFRNHQIGACEGAVLSASMTWTRDSNEVAFDSLTDPSGADVLDRDGDPVVQGAITHGHRSVLPSVTFTTAGTHVLQTRLPIGRAGFAAYDLTIELRSPAKPASHKRHVLSVAEPFLDPAEVPFPGEPGDTVFFTGRGFARSPLPKVRFGDAVAQTVSVSADGKRIDVVVPPRVGGSVVAVTVVNPDGQATRRPGYFAYLPPAEVYEVLDAVTGEPLRRASAGGGRAVRVVGKNFERGYAVMVGPSRVENPTVVSTTELAFSLPATPQGNWTVRVVDPYQRVGSSPFTIFLKTPPALAAEPYAPGALKVNLPATVTIRGANFETGDVLFVAGAEYPSTFLDASRRTFDLPALPAGPYSIRLVDSIGTAVDGPDLHVKLPPTIASVSVFAGDVLGTTEIPIAGGTILQVDGTDFLANDVVTLGGTRVTSFVARTSTRKRFAAPAHAAGLAALRIVDGADQEASLADAFRYVGFTDMSASRVPAASSVDDLSAFRGAAGDIDRDGLEDDVVLVSPLGDAPGSRTVKTRVLRGNASGTLTDVTSTAIPPAGTGVSAETFDANCAALGDVDGSAGLDLLIGGRVATGDTTYQQVRLLRNDGAGTFSLDLTNSPPTRYAAYVPGVYYYYYVYSVYGPMPQKGSPQAIAIGDVDNDGDRDVVVGFDHYQSRQVYIDPRFVNFNYPTPIIYALYYVNYAQYLPATRVYDNRIGAGLGLVDVTSLRMPDMPNSSTGPVTAPALHCKDLALGALDENASLDLVVAWNDPTTVSPTGLKSFEAGGSSSDSAKVATRVFLNSGTGDFRTDHTEAWMPPGASPEFWQADRVAVADLDRDGAAELILLLGRGLDAWTGTETRTRSALRVLRNDRGRFTDVTSTAIPAVDTALKDDWRGDALSVRDVNGDGWNDILVATRTALKDAGGNAVSRLRVFFGGSGLTFKVSRAFQELPSAETGEADDLLFLGDLGGPFPAFLLLSEQRPTSSPAARPFLRAHEWKR